MSDANARRYGHEIRRLEKQHGEMLTPGDIVDSAESNSSPIHNWFDWDDTSAARKHRLQQARMLVAMVHVVAEDGKPIRSTLHVYEDSIARGVYVDIEVVSKNEGYREQVVEDALKRAQAWATTYQRYAELLSIRQAIDATVKSLKTKKKKKKTPQPV